MDVSRETPNVATKPKRYDLASILVPRARIARHCSLPRRGAPRGDQGALMVDSQTKNLDLRGFDSVRFSPRGVEFLDP